MGFDDVPDWFKDRKKIIKHRRGAFASLGTLNILVGELVFTDDTNELYGRDEDSINPYLISGLSQGLIANIPAFGVVDRQYYASDEGLGYLDNGSGWLEVFRKLDQYADDDTSVYLGKDSIGQGNVTPGYSRHNSVLGSRAGDALTIGSYNSLFGRYAGAALTSEDCNCLFGYYAGAALTGENNVMMGVSAGRVGTTVTGSVLVGFDAGRTLSIGDYNVLVGMNAGYNITSGSYNTLIGTSVGYTNIDIKSYNVMIGYQAGYLSDTSGSVLIGVNAGNDVAVDYAVIIGYQAGYDIVAGLGAVIIGYQSVFKSSDAQYLTAVGYQSAYELLSGSYGTYIGYKACFNSTIGNNNTAVGYKAGHDITTGSDNTLVGANAGYSLDTHGSNVIVGLNAGYSLIGDYNVFVGLGTGQATTSSEGGVMIGYQAGNLVTTGDGNILLGYQAGDNITTGSYNIIIGFDVNALSASGDYQLNIGGFFTGSYTLSHQLFDIQGDFRTDDTFIQDRVIYEETWPNGDQNLNGDLGVWTIAASGGGWAPTRATGYYYPWSGNGAADSYLTSPGFDLQDYEYLDYSNLAANQHMTQTRVFVKCYLLTRALNDLEYLAIEVYDGSAWYEVYKHQSAEASDGWVKAIADITPYINRGGDTQIRFHGTGQGGGDYYAIGRVYICESNETKDLVYDERVKVYNSDDIAIADTGGVNDYSAINAGGVQAEIFDPYNMYDGNVTWAVTIKKRGTYWIKCQMWFDLSTIGDMGLRIVSDFIGATEEFCYDRHTLRNAADDITLSCSTIVELEEGDQIWPEVMNNTGNNVTIIGHPGKSFFCVHRLSWCKDHHAIY